MKYCSILHGHVCVMICVPFGLPRWFQLLEVIQQENIIKSRIFCGFTIWTPLGLWSIFFNTFFDTRLQKMCNATVPDITLHQCKRNLPVTCDLPESYAVLRCAFFVVYIIVSLHTVKWRLADKAIPEAQIAICIVPEDNTFKNVWVNILLLWHF